MHSQCSRHEGASGQPIDVGNTRKERKCPPAAARQWLPRPQLAPTWLLFLWPVLKPVATPAVTTVLGRRACPP